MSSKHTPILSKVFLLLSLCQLISLMSLIVLIMSDYFRSPIQCLLNPYAKAIETYCYIHSVFTLENMPNSLQNYDYYPGIGPPMDGKRAVISHQYFFWMPYFLCLQVFVFGFPRQIWNSLEGNLAWNLSPQTFPMKINSEKIERSAKYFVATLHSHKSRAFIFLGCEALGVASIFANIFFTNLYLGGRFLNAIPQLLFNILRVDEIDNVYDNLFPKLGKCTFHMFGPSGSVVGKDALCILVRNLLTGRIYTLLFAVYSTAAVVASLSLMLRVCIFISPKLRKFFILKKMLNPEYVKDDIENLMEFCDIGDWFLLFHLSCTMVNFNIWLGKVVKQLQETNKNNIWSELNEEMEKTKRFSRS